MTDAPRDNNNVEVLTVLSNADGVTPAQVQVNPTTHVVQISNGAGGSDLSEDDAVRDNNARPVAMGVSNADGVTPCPIYLDIVTGKLLVDLT